MIDEASDTVSEDTSLDSLNSDDTHDLGEAGQVQGVEAGGPGQVPVLGRGWRREVGMRGTVLLLWRL